MRILIADCTIDPDSWGSENLRRAVLLGGPDCEIVTRRAPDSDLPSIKELDGFDGIVISGSKTAPYVPTSELPWLGQLEDVIRFANDRDRPILGVCFGHQMIARTLGGIQTVRKAERAEIGWTQIQFGESGRLLRGLSNPFYSFSVHFDEVISAPPKTRVLARSELCSVQAYEHESKPLYGIQFHPEKNLQEAERSLRFFAKKKVPLLNVGPEQKFKSERFYQESVAKTVFGNFIDVCKKA